MSFRKARLGRPHRASGPRRGHWPAVFLFCAGLLPAGLSPGCSSAGPGPAAGLSASPGTKAVCWLLFDMESLFCSPCLAPLLEFCRSLPVAVQENRIRGILVSGARPDRVRDARHAQVIQKKIRGFVKANDLQFPIALDGSHLFDSLAKSNVQALLFDDVRQTVKVYAFPLKPEDKGEIMRLLLY